jgi:flavin reductase (DIM6/NTAB) family NADH-FMN oxidoreductase RutF
LSNQSTDYRATLGIFPTGVTVITCLDQQGVAAGFTASSFNSVSLEPKLILWSLAKSSSLITVFEKTERYAVHFLSTDQVALSNTFASPVIDRFAQIDWSLSEGQVPVLADCAAHLECEARYCYEGGDHLIFVGEVIHHQSDEEKTALAYHRGNYSCCAPID